MRHIAVTLLALTLGAGSAQAKDPVTRWLDGVFQPPAPVAAPPRPPVRSWEVRRARRAPPRAQRVELAPLPGVQHLRGTYYGAEMGRGARTASGEPFRPGGLTAAHRTLPFGTRLHVTNPATGRSVTVRVNDRGPFTRGFHLDLAHGAARAIGFTSGLLMVSRL